MTDLSESEFEDLIQLAISELPDEILEHMNNIAITIANWPSSEELHRAGVAAGSWLFGLYEGIPLTKRSSHYGLVAPDRIILYRGPLQTVFRAPSRMREQVRRTVVHEIAHHFGIDEARIRQLGY